jgi:hypothetical protein
MDSVSSEVLPYMGAYHAFGNNSGFLENATMSLEIFGAFLKMPPCLWKNASFPGK